MKKYRPSLHKSEKWDDIENNYFFAIKEYNLKLEPMLELVKYIQKSKLSQRIYGLTSMYKLVVSIYSPIERDRESLHIEFEPITKKWYFRYYSKPGKTVEIEKTYEESLGIEKFEKYIKLLKW